MPCLSAYSLAFSSVREAIPTTSPFLVSCNAGIVLLTIRALPSTPQRNFSLIKLSFFQNLTRCTRVLSTSIRYSDSTNDGVTNRRALAYVPSWHRRAWPFQPAGPGAGWDGPLRLWLQGQRPARGF